MPWNEAALSTCTNSTSTTLALEETTAHASVWQYECRGARVIAAAGEFDLGSIAPLHEALDAAARQYPKVVLDASAVTFADSTFLNLMILTHQAGTLRVVAPSVQVRRLCEVTGVDRFLEIRQTVEEAAAS